jgi:hypothetical protein
MAHLNEHLQSILAGKVPEGMMLIETKYQSSEINLLGVNKVGCVIPLNMVENVIEILESECVNAKVLYQFPIDNDTTIDIPGNRIEKIALYLREARDIGVTLGSYRRYF